MADNQNLKVVRVGAGNEATKGSEMGFFVVTGSREPPIGSLADNSNFPSVKQFYVRDGRHNEYDGVIVHILFDGPAQGEGVAVNLLQAGATGDYQVIPML